MLIISRSLKRRFILYKPLVIVIAYFIFISILFVWGPIEWKPQNPVLLIIFLFFSHLLLILGYYSTIAKLEKSGKISEVSYSNPTNHSHSFSRVSRILKYLIPINMLIVFLNIIRFTGMTSVNIPEMYNNFVNGIVHPSVQYSLKFNTPLVFGGSLYPAFLTLFAPLLWPVLPLSLVYFKNVSKLNRFFVLLTVFFESVRWISVGTNKGIIDVILILMIVLFLGQQKKKYNNLNVSTKRGFRFIRYFVIFVLAISGLLVFENNISSRVNENYYVLSQSIGNAEINLESPIMKIIPSKLDSLVVYTSQYLTQGYYGLSLTLDEQFIPMFGVGNSYFLIENLEQISGNSNDIFQFTYIYRVSNENWSPYVNWHSIYAWLANDISFVGVVFLMFLIGKYFAYIYVKSLVSEDAISTVLFCLLMIAFFYFTCNNQILSSPASFMTFWTFNLLLLLRKGKVFQHHSEKNIESIRI